VRFAEGVKSLLVPLTEVSQHPKNPNNGDDENLIESIQINGFCSVITADRRTGFIVAGNTRYRALHALGATHIPVAWVDHWEFEEDAVRYMINDNASSRRTVMDDAALAELLARIAETPQGLAGSSITQAEYENMLLDIATTHEEPEGFGFGANAAPLGLYQIVLEFKDNEDERDAVFAELADRYENVRTANL
jgi:hypothetical protein